MKSLREVACSVGEGGCKRGGVLYADLVGESLRGKRAICTVGFLGCDLNSFATLHVSPHHGEQAALPSAPRTRSCGPTAVHLAAQAPGCLDPSVSAASLNSPASVDGRNIRLVMITVCIFRVS